jgi:hypothetical protein
LIAYAAANCAKNAIEATLNGVSEEIYGITGRCCTDTSCRDE